MNIGSIGIYKITNLINNKVYIGSTRVSFRDRWSKHKSKLRKNDHHSKHLQSAFNKYGEESFKFEVIKDMKGFEVSDILNAEEYYIEKYKSYYREFGYNMTSSAIFGCDPKLMETVVGFNIYGDKCCEFECGEDAIRNGYYHVRESCNVNSSLEIAISKSNNVYFRYKSEIGDIDKIKVKDIDHILIVDALTGSILERHEDLDTVYKLNNTHKWLTDKMKKMSITPDVGTIYCRESKLKIVMDKIRDLKVVCVFDKDGKFMSKHLDCKRCGTFYNRTRSAIKGAVCTVDNLKLVKEKYVLIFKNNEIPNNIFK